MNPFSIMMAASKTTNKKATPVQEAPPVRKGKRGRPPREKLPSEPLVPFTTMDSKSSKDVTASRRNYDIGISKEVMDNALTAAIQSRGHHMARTASLYGVSRKSLDTRYESYQSNSHQAGSPEKCWNFSGCHFSGLTSKRSSPLIANFLSQRSPSVDLGRL